MYDSSYGVDFNGHHSSEFGLIALKGKKVGMPAKNKILVEIPFSNSKIDLSNIYGGPYFEERTYTQVFHLQVDQYDKERLYILWTKIVNWLMGTKSKVPLYDDVMHSYYYLAEVQKAPTFDEMLHWGTLTVEWQCYPFRISALQEGNDVWDTFCFDLDVAQEVSFDVSGSLQVTIINNGETQVDMTVKASAPMTVSTTSVSAGTTKDAIALPVGTNNFAITGTGHIDFIFYKELI